MSRLVPIHGAKFICILCNEFGFSFVRQKGSHVTLTRGHGHVSMPAHRIGVGLLSSILRDCGISRSEYLKNA